MTTYTEGLSFNAGSARSGLASSCVAKVYDNAQNLQATITTGWLEREGATGAYGGASVVRNVAWGVIEVVYKITGQVGFAEVENRPVDGVAAGLILPATAPGISLTTSYSGGPDIPQVFFQNQSGSVITKVVDSSGNPFNVGQTTVVKLLTYYTGTSNTVQTVTGVVSQSLGTGAYDLITFPIVPANVPTPGRWRYVIRDYSTNAIYQSGSWLVKNSPQ